MRGGLEIRGHAGVRRTESVLIGVILSEAKILRLRFASLRMTKGEETPSVSFADSSLREGA